ncbi:MAG: porin, partial [Arenimonas sp.]|nr:porin [Arenimonas sp.]
MKLAPKLLAAAVLAALSTPALAEITIDVIGGSEVSFEGLLQSDANWFNNDITDLNGPGTGTGSNGRNSEFEL